VGRAVAVQLRAAEETRGELARLAARRSDLEREVVRLERRRVAREVHDLVGHGLSLVSVHAAVSAQRLERGEGTVTGALDEIRELAASTQRELVALSELLRSPGIEGELAHPDAGLTALHELVDTARRHGHTVELEVADVTLAPALAEAVTDIVREGLTNVRKHAGPVPTEVVVSAAGDDALEVVVANAPGSPTLGEGTRSGLRGLTERVVDLGGHIEAGPTPTGGWRLACRLPLGAADRLPLGR
jgi:signal transduction histidine kinase